MKRDEIFRQRINRLITEEFGINNDFDEVAKATANSITKSLTSLNFTKRNDGTLVKNYKETVTLNNKRVSIYVTNYYFETIEEKEDFQANHIILQSYNPITNMIMIPLYTIGENNDYEEFYDTIYHELDHFFKDTFLQSPKYPTPKYLKAISNLESENEISRRIAEVYYCADRNEQDAMINGLYGNLSNVNYCDDWAEILKNTEAAIWIKKLYDNYKFFKSNEIDEKYLNGKSKESFINFIIKVIKSFERKFARTVFKLKKDKFINEGVRPHIHPNSNMKQGQLFWI